MDINALGVAFLNVRVWSHGEILVAMSVLSAAHSGEVNLAETQVLEAAGGGC